MCATLGCNGHTTGAACVVVAACTEIGQLDGLLETILACTLQSPQYVSTVSRFDLVILVCHCSALCTIIVNCMAHVLLRL